MNPVNRVITLIALMAILAGCDATKVAVRHDVLGNTNTIALISVSEPAPYVGHDFSSTALMCGVVGGAVAGGSSANAGKSLDQLAAERKFKAGERFTRLLEDKLVSLGYQVEVVTVTREKETALLQGYKDVNHSGADAILDVAIESIGYATEHPILSPQ